MTRADSQETDLQQEIEEIYWKDYETSTGKTAAFMDRLNPRAEMLTDEYYRIQNVWNKGKVEKKVKVNFDWEFLAYKVSQFLRELSKNEDGEYYLDYGTVEEEGKSLFNRGYEMYKEQREKERNEWIEETVSNLSTSLGIPEEKVRENLQSLIG